MGKPNDTDSHQYGLLPSTWLTRQNKNDRVIIAVDFDCFYASVALRDRPELQNKPVAVVQKHLCVTVNYIARSAEHGSVKKMSTVNEALQRCPDIVMIDGSDLLPFRRANREIVEAARKFFPAQCPIEKNGLDELFIDVTSMVENDKQQPQQKYPWHFTGHLYAKTNDSDEDAYEDDTIIRRRLMIGSHIANNLRKHILEMTKLTCCAGIATSKLVSKIAVNLHKPNQQSIILPNAVANTIAELSPGELMGLGHSTLTALQQWGGKEYNTVAQLAQGFPLHEGMKSVRLLRQALSSSASSSFRGHVNDEKAYRLIQMFHGIDGTKVVDLNQGENSEQDGQIKDAPKSISVEDACKDCQDLKTVRSIVKTLSMRLLTLLIEDAKTYGRNGCMRRAKTMSVGYRHRGDGYKSTWRSSQAPVEVTGTNLSSVSGTAVTKVRDAIESRVLKVLRENAAVGVGRPFQLTLIGIGVSNFHKTYSSGPSHTSSHPFFTASNPRTATENSSDDHAKASLFQSMRISGAINKNNHIRKVGNLKTKSIATFFSGGGSASAKKRKDDDKKKA